MSQPPFIGLTTVQIEGEDKRLRDSLTVEYAEAVVKAGGVPILIPLSTLESSEDETLLRHLYRRLDGILLPGGGDIHPEVYGKSETSIIRGTSRIRDDVEKQLVRWAFEDDVPLLGICRGHQMMNVALGGSLHIDVETMQNGNSTIKHDADAVRERDRLMHDVYVEPASRLAGALGNKGEPILVNSLHHQAVNQLSPELVATSYADDGIVEGIEAPKSRFFMGVQWHPEAIVKHVPQMQQLFCSFVSASATRSIAVAGI